MLRLWGTCSFYQFGTLFGWKFYFFLHIGEFFYSIYLMDKKLKNCDENRLTGKPKHVFFHFVLLSKYFLEPALVSEDVDKMKRKSRDDRLSKETQRRKRLGTEKNSEKSIFRNSKEFIIFTVSWAYQSPFGKGNSSRKKLEDLASIAIAFSPASFRSFSLDKSSSTPPDRVSKETFEHVSI